jgi:hypothetical protein
MKKKQSIIHNKFIPDLRDDGDKDAFPWFQREGVGG